MIELVDTHCHLTDRRLVSDLDDVLARARAAGVTRIVAVGGGGPIELSEASAELAASRPFLRATAGIHPHDASSYDDATEARIEALLARPEVVAVGETGLDYYYEHSPRETQRNALARHVALALRYQVPIVLHCRDAEADLRAVLDSEAPGSLNGVVHCFTGGYEDARWAINKGLLVSFTGILTFKGSDALREVARRLPLDRIMVETDAPYLAPAPMRGKRNEPSYVLHTARALAEVRGTTLEKIAEATSLTAAQLFYDGESAGRAQSAQTP